MELKSSTTTTTTINETWKLCTLGGFLSFFVLALFLTSNPQTVQFTASRTSTFISFFTSPSSKFNSTPPSPPPSAAIVFASINTTTSLSSFNASHPASSSTDAGGIDLSTQKNGSITVRKSEEGPTPPASGPTVATNVTPSVNTTRVDDRVRIGGDGNSIISSYKGKDKSLSLWSSCNLFEGKWVYRPTVSPMYRVGQCPFLEEKMSCRRNGRPDSDYEGWSWEATDCDIPLFNGTDMLERLRGKRVIIAGDSLNRNQWESLACLIYSSLHPSRVFIDAEGSQYKVLRAMDYGFSLEFYWSPFLVFLDENNKSGRKVLNLDKLVPSSAQWRGAHVMLFNSGHWWLHRDVWDVFQYKGEIIPDMPKELAYELALTTWSNWLTKNVNPITTSIFFRSVSPEHKGKYWCLNATTPISNDDTSYINNFPKVMMEVAERKVGSVRRKGVHVTYLNITGLSGYRKDAHPAIYRYKAWQTKLVNVKAEIFADCSHWCLPGLPDTWNRLMYASMVFSEKEKKKVITSPDMVVLDGGNVTDGSHRMIDTNNNNLIDEERKKLIN